MARLESVETEDLRGALEDVDGKRPTLRLAAAIAHKHGVTQSELATWFDVERKTVYNWLTRFESADSMATAARDRERPGRPPRLTDRQRREVRSLLDEPPSAVGFEEPEWSAPLLQRLLEERWDASYARSTCRRLLDDLG